MSPATLMCQDFVELVTAYLEGTLPRRERRRIDAHLRGCDGCSAYLESFRVTIRSVGALPPEPEDPHTRETLMRAFRDLRD